MRLSSDKGDAGYEAWCILNGDGKVADVYLDGEIQKHASMADTDAGEIRRCVMTPAGNIAFDKHVGEVLTETIKGKVEIVIRDRK
ncbi:hypothetical protein AGRHK599_LOCUS1207 [Rhizobium rhizogenes]|uniref:Uncharacterized protein n=1 Tax=Rhizobium rhizogenes TaxID=359 RepID=A0AAN2A1K6_RHIRH|nr:MULTISPECIES: hypothetical protein [Rhizobium/Agrobacterium group]AQS61788.1 hypothetical protein B0909_05640 [Rhizobium rhizogenes]MCZ7442982.1 hypothetical protein [Rhizobium rhizogenes]NSZ78970.1 hypothetical protein [Agrobacterium tumefaciens]OAM65765.1 hypothetical protein A8L48_22485 [Rhizobium rhizogenes]CAD0211182.1 hypothetical protein AGRHK599_LOCUS1207 [Rhizobium rhizogenes]